VEVKPPPKNFYEVDRLAYIVNAIEYDCALIPIGSMRLTPTHELRLSVSCLPNFRYNDSF